MDGLGDYSIRTASLLFHSAEDVGSLVCACAILAVNLVLRSPFLRIVLALIFVGYFVYLLITGEHHGRGQATPFEVRFWACVKISIGLTVIVVTIYQMINPPSTDNDKK